jgi:hypothetical protein
MKQDTKSSYAGYRYPAEIISHAGWLYLRFTLSLRDVEELLTARGIVVAYETVRRRRPQIPIAKPPFSRGFLPSGLSAACRPIPVAPAGHSHTAGS